MGSNTVNTTDVVSIDESIEKVTKNGGEINVPKMVVPGVGWFAYFKDPEEMYLVSCSRMNLQSNQIIGYKDKINE